MLRRLGDVTDLPASKLEFNPPAHGTWNIVHIGMLVPEAHQIYVCAVNCMRGVVLTAAEMGAQDRFSCVMLKEEDITRGTVERVTLEGIRDVLRKLEAHGKLPPCVIVFPVCTHLFLGVPMNHVYRQLEEEFPQVDFVHAFMDPISRRRLIPDRRLRKVMYDPLTPLDPDDALVAMLGSDFPLDQDSDLRILARRGGKRLASVHDCATYAEFKGLGAASSFICTFPGGQYGTEKCAQRLGRPCLYVPGSLSYDVIEEQERTICSELCLPLPDFAHERALCDEELGRTQALIADTPIVIDALAHPRPFELVRLLIEHGMNVTEVYVDVVNPEEQNAFDYVREHAPEVQVSSMTTPDMRVSTRGRDKKTLAIGQRAAWYAGTAFFVNIVQGGGLWGFAGIRTMARLMQEAWSGPKDTRDLIPRKGLGCPSCF